jgi:hypothetical protein
MAMVITAGTAMASQVETLDGSPPPPLKEGYVSKKGVGRCFVRLLDDGALRRSENCFRLLGLARVETWMQTAETIRFLSVDGKVVVNLNIQRPGVWRSERGGYRLDLPVFPASKVPMSQ